MCCEPEGRVPNWTTISADGGPVGNTPFLLTTYVFIYVDR